MKTKNSDLNRHGCVEVSAMWMKPERTIVTLIVLLCACGIATADTLETKAGKIIKGSYMGGTQNSVRFQADNELKTFQTSEVLAITFESSAAPASESAAAKTAPAASPAPAPDIKGPATVPAGTVLLVTTTSQVSSEDAPGRRFSATLAGDIAVNGVTVAKTGTTVYGTVGKSAEAGRMAGKSELQISLTEINIDGKVYPLMTTNFAEAGQGSFRKTARNVGVGALAGSAFGGSEGAKKGAAIGAGVSLIRKGESVTIPVGAILEFRMTQPLTITK
jgi:hypothetical protein